jgi:ribosomal protein L37AE/L43A
MSAHAKVYIAVSLLNKLRVLTLPRTEAGRRQLLLKRSEELCPDCGAKLSQSSNFRYQWDCPKCGEGWHDDYKDGGWQAQLKSKTHYSRREVRHRQIEWAEKTLTTY